MLPLLVLKPKERKSKLKTKLLSALFIAVLAFGFAATLTAPRAHVDAQPAGKTIVFTTAYGMGALLLDEIETWLTGLGHTVRIAAGGINASILSGADALILAGPYGPVAGIEEFNATNAPAFFDAIWDWFNGTAGGLGGGKFLWIGGDSDYGGRDWINMNMSLALETVESALRIDLTSVEDPVSNCGGQPYRVVANITETTDPDGAQITTGITHGALFHGPAPVYGINGTGHAVPLHNNTIANVFNIMYTTATGYITEGNPLIPALAHSDGSVGSWVMMAGEKNVGHWGNSRVIASGASAYGDYQPLWTNVYYGVNMNGSTLVKQAILWGLEATPTIIPGPPSTPVLSGPSSTSDGVVELTWTASTDDSAVDHYQVQASDASDFSNLLIDANVTTTSYTAIVSLYPAGNYYFRVRAFDDEDNPSGWSNTITTSWAGLPGGIPGFPFEAILLALAFALIPVLIIRRRRK